MSFEGMTKCESCKQETVKLKGEYPALYYECNTCGEIFTVTRLLARAEKAEAELELERIKQPKEDSDKIISEFLNRR